MFYQNKKKAYSFSEGVQGFSAEQILASEKNEWTVGGDMLNRENTFAAKHRNSYFEYDTWAGADNRNFKKYVKYGFIVGVYCVSIVIKSFNLEVSTCQ